MKKSDIRRAYEAMTPTADQKDKIFRQIMDSPSKTANTRHRHTKSRFLTQLATAAALFAVILTGGFAIGRTIQGSKPVIQNPLPDVELTDTTAIPAAYGRIIATCRAAVDKGWDEAQCSTYQISPRFSDTDHARGNAGYQILDIDGNGTEELVLGHLDYIWDLYTLETDGNAIQLLTDTNDGTVYHLREGGRITRERTTKVDGYFDQYILEGTELVQEISIYGVDTSYKDLLTGKAISSQEALDLIDRYDQQNLQLSYFYEVPDFLRDGSEILERYLPTIELYKTALLENWTAERCNQADISPQILYDTTNKQNLGWYLLDLDGNGVEELIISDGEHLFDLYTLRSDADTPVLVVSGDPYDYNLCYDGTIRRWMTNGSFTYLSWFRFSENDYVEEVKLIYDIAKNQYSVSIDGQEPRPIPKEEAGNYMKHDLQLSLIPFIEQAGENPTEPTYDPIVEPYRPEPDGQSAYNLEPKVEPYGYAEHIAWLIPWREEQFENPPPLYYYLHDWNRDGVTDMILGYADEVLSVWTYMYDGNSNTIHLSLLNLSDQELSELDATWQTWDIRDITEFSMEE